MYRETHIQSIADDLRAHEEVSRSTKENGHRQIEKMDELLKQADKLAPEARAEYLIDQGVEIPEHAYWIRDKTYTGNNKEIYYCTHCDHWQSVKKQKDQIMYMRRCPFCGSKMTVKAEDET